MMSAQSRRSEHASFTMVPTQSAIVVPRYNEARVCAQMNLKTSWILAGGTASSSLRTMASVDQTAEGPAQGEFASIPATTGIYLSLGEST
jgi:hypothetical protein